MTEQEWNGVIAVLTANWPHSLPPEMALRKWRADLDDLAGETVLAAVEAIYRDGREFPPNGAQIRDKVRQLEHGDSDWSHGYQLASSEYHWLNGDGSPNPEALERLAEQDPIAAEVVKRLGTVAWGMRLIADETTWRAQFRDVYREVAGMLNRKRRYEGLPGREGPGELRRAPFTEIAERTAR